MGSDYPPLFNAIAQPSASFPLQQRYKPGCPDEGPCTSPTHPVGREVIADEDDGGGHGGALALSAAQRVRQQVARTAHVAVRVQVRGPHVDRHASGQRQHVCNAQADVVTPCRTGRGASEKQKTLRALGIEQGWESGCLDRMAWKEKIEG